MMRYKLRFSPFVFMILSACGLRSQDFNQMVDDLIDQSVKVIYPDSLNTLLRNGKRVVILDAREEQEYRVSHLNNAQWVGYKTFEVSTLKADKNDEIIVYCSVGYRSEKIGEKLQKAGYKNVLNLYGGIFGWSNEGYPVFDEQNHETKKVHAYSKSWGKWLTSGEKVYDE